MLMANFFTSGETFKNIEKVKSHISHNHNSNVTLTMFGKVRDFQCSVCKIMFLKEDHRILHICGTIPPIWNGQSSTSRQKCPKCDQEFANYRSSLPLTFNVYKVNTRGRFYVMSLDFCG